MPSPPFIDDAVLRVAEGKCYANERCIGCEGSVVGRFASVAAVNTAIYYDRGVSVAESCRFGEEDDPYISSNVIHYATTVSC